MITRRDPNRSTLGSRKHNPSDQVFEYPTGGKETRWAPRDEWGTGHASPAGAGACAARRKASRYGNAPATRRGYAAQQVVSPAPALDGERASPSPGAGFLFWGLAFSSGEAKAKAKPMPSLCSDAEAVAFTAEADLTPYDLSGFKPMQAR